jgi:hypothetical protein
MGAAYDAAFWADAVAEAYAAGAKPPLTQALVDEVRAALLQALAPGSQDAGQADTAARLNGALDAFEVALRSVVGPRIASLDETRGAVVMEHRSEAGQPLRAFGGQ